MAPATCPDEAGDSGHGDPVQDCWMRCQTASHDAPNSGGGTARARQARSSHRGPSPHRAVSTTRRCMVVAHTIRVATTRKHVRSAAAWAFVSYADSPAGLAAWMLDHDTDSYEKISRAFYRRAPNGWPDPGQDPRQPHAVLADQHRDPGRADVLGGRAKHRRGGRAAATAGLASGRLHGVPRRDLPGRRAAGPRRSTPTSSTSTRPTGTT